MPNLSHLGKPIKGRLSELDFRIHEADLQHRRVGACQKQAEERER